MTDYRALCAELLNVIDSLPCETNYKGESRYVSPIDEDVVFRTRAALAQPGPVAPTDEEIEECFFQRWWFNGGSAIRPHKSGGLRWMKPAPLSKS